MVPSGDASSVAWWPDRALSDRHWPAWLSQRRVATGGADPIYELPLWVGLTPWVLYAQSAALVREAGTVGCRLFFSDGARPSIDDRALVIYDLHLCLLGDRQGVINLNTQISDGALELSVAQ